MSALSFYCFQQIGESASRSRLTPRDLISTIDARFVQGRSTCFFQFRGLGAPQGEPLTSPRYGERIIGNLETEEYLAYPEPAPADAPRLKMCPRRMHPAVLKALECKSPWRAWLYSRVFAAASPTRDQSRLPLGLRSRRVRLETGSRHRVLRPQRWSLMHTAPHVCHARVC